jgi:hypothetical protein
MRKSIWIPLTLGVVLAAGAALALEARVAGRGGSMTQGCPDMMAGGGMMGGSRPNERWRSEAR